MATATTMVLRQDANMPVRKRSITLDDELIHPESPSPKKVEFSLPHLQVAAPTPRRPTATRHFFYPARRRQTGFDTAGRRHGSTRPSMQSQNNPRSFAQSIPSFMSVYEEGSTTTSEEAQPKESGLGALHDLIHSPIQSCFSPTTGTFSVFHQPRNSTSTSASESPDSSPTTTVSTLDSSSLTESSPGTSPETPATTLFPITAMLEAARFRPPERSKVDPSQGTFFEMQRSTTPAKKPRNLKNLAVNTISAHSLGRAALSATLKPEPASNEVASAPRSPGFVKPPTPPKRKVTNLGLTLMTPASNAVPRLAIPATPSLARPNTLRHFQSSPSLPLCTPSGGPTGGMTLPTLQSRPRPIGFADIPLEDEEDDEPNFDVPQSQELKPESYPNGPIRIYESGVDLYYEPTAEVASQYDVIFNVASEVKNPFHVAAAGKEPSVQISNTVGVLENPEAANSPETPKATPIVPSVDSTLFSKQPEYIHIPWEHNTDIVPDLHRLVKVIDERVQQGKRILVHCQCGVSRSASLIVAYGLFKNPGMSVQEAYDAVKKRSKWIGPNMSLIMQLQEFRSGLQRNTRQNSTFSNQLFAPRKMSTGLSSGSNSERFGATSSSTPSTPRTAPLRQDTSSPMRLSTGSLGPFSAAPLDHPVSAFWDTSFRRSWGSSPVKSDFGGLSSMSLVTDTPYVDPMGHVLPVLTVINKPAEPPAEPASEPVVGAERTTVAPISIVPSLAADRQDGEYTPLSPPAEESTPERNFVLPELPKLPLSQSEAPRPLAFQVPAKRKTPNFSRQLPLRKNWPESSITSMDTLMSPRAEEFHMVGFDKPAEAESADAFGIMSPVKTSFGDPFASLGFPKQEEKPMGFQPLPLLPLDPPPPQRATLQIAGQLTSSLPSLTTVALSTPPRKDLLNEKSSFTFPSISSVTPKPRRTSSRLKPKFSSPNLYEQVRLRQLQENIEAALPHAPSTRAMDDLDALMSPRATEFTVNPFHALLSPTADDRSKQFEFPDIKVSGASSLNVPGASSEVPTSGSDVDPRSPVQHLNQNVGIQPITRSIFDVL